MDGTTLDRRREGGGQPDLGTRDRQVLHAVVHLHITTGKPVGSKAVAQRLRNRWSSATIRSVMADLGDSGYISQPHTSAGRIPTWLGYRCYVDTMIRSGALAEVDPKPMNAVHSGLDLSSLMRDVSGMLASVSRFAGLAIAPSPQRSPLEHLELIQLRPRELLAVLVTRTGVVHHRRLEIEFDVSRSDLEHFHNYLNTQLRGLTLPEMRSRIRSELEQERARADGLVRAALLLGQQALRADDPADVFIEGRTSLFELEEFESLDRLRPVLVAMERRELWLELLDRSIAAPGVHVQIGAENPMDGMDSCTIITASYGRPEERLGTLGIIGPMRMNYARMIPFVERTARLVSDRLSALERTW